MDHKTDTDKGRKALEAYLKDCDDHAIVPDVGGAFHYAFMAGRASLAASAGSDGVASLSAAGADAKEAFAQTMRGIYGNEFPTEGEFAGEHGWSDHWAIFQAGLTLRALTQGAAIAAGAVPDLSTPGEWFVRYNSDKTDCFVSAPDCKGYAYGAEILGDDEYTTTNAEYDRGELDAGLKRKIADCELIVAAVKAYRAPHGQAPAQPAATVIKRGADREWMSERLGHLPDGIYSLYLATPSPQAAQQAPAGAVPDWLPFSKRTQIADRHGAKVTAEFNSLVRDVISTYLQTHAPAAPSTPASPTIEGESNGGAS